MLRPVWDWVDRVARRHLADKTDRSLHSARLAEDRHHFIEQLRSQAGARLQTNHLGEGLLMAFDRKDHPE